MNQFQTDSSALTDVAQWTGLSPSNREVACWIASQGICLGCWPGPRFGCARGNGLMFLSLFLLPSPFLQK